MTTERPRYIVVASSEMPSIAYKIMLWKAFGQYPPDNEIEFVINPQIVSDDKVYVLDRQEIEKLPKDYDFLSGDLDDLYKVGVRGA